MASRMGSSPASPLNMTTGRGFIALAALMAGASNQTIVVGILGMALIGKHWQNIQRLMAGQVRGRIVVRTA